jgi:hypothetical protein
MKLSIHPKIRGKPEKVERKNDRPLFKCNGETVNLGYGWQNIECDTWQEIFELITTDGYATSAELVGNHRCDDDYVSRQVVMVDIDDGMTIQELFENDFYNEFGAGFYTTARHTDTAHRFRILFVLEEPITDCLTMRKVIRGLLEIFDSGDKSCKDASRIYYGIPNCLIKECRDKILPTFITNALVDMIDSIDMAEAQKQKTYIIDPSQNLQYDDIYVDQLLSNIASKVGNLKGQYDEWRTIAWATCSVVGISNAKSLMLKHFYEKTKGEMTTLMSWKQGRGPTVGSLIKLSGISLLERRLMDVEFKIRQLKGKHGD